MSIKKFITPDQKRRDEEMNQMLQALEELHQDVMDGEVTAIAFCYVNDKGVVGNGWHGHVGSRLSLSIQMLKERFMRDIVAALFPKEGK